MKFLSLPLPTKEEKNRIYEIQMYLLIQELQQVSPDIQQQLYALAMLADLTPTDIVMVSNKLLEPNNIPTKEELSIALCYLNVPVRDITKKYTHHKTYYKHVYTYFDEENTNKIFNRLTEEQDLVIIKLINYIKKNFYVYDIAKRGIIYG